MPDNNLGNIPDDVSYYKSVDMSYNKLDDMSDDISYNKSVDMLS